MSARRVLVVSALVMALFAAVTGPTSASPLAPVSSALSRLLSSAGSLTVLVHGATLADARRAVAAAGMRPVTELRTIGVVAASGSAAQIDAVRRGSGVSYVEANDPVRLFASPGTTATRSRQAQQTLYDSAGRKLDGTGVTVAVIDSGIDPTHPAFRGADGKTRVVRNLKSLCLDEASIGTGCILDVGTTVDTDLLSVGGHGTHVSGIAAGRPYSLGDGTQVGGSAPGAKIVSISTGAVILIIGADAALNWVLENHRAPCGAGVSTSACPPIKVINNSYGPSGGGEFDPNSATVKLQRALAAAGVVTVWANGNDGGDGSANLSNPPGQDPTPGVLSVASYNDQGAGTTAGTVSDFSSRGHRDRTSTWPDVSAPGENIVSACRLHLVICATGLQPKNGPGLLDLGTYNVISGTSMAAPQITGIVAQLFQAAPGASPGDVEHAIKSTAVKYANGAPYSSDGTYQTSHDKGTGLVDTVAAATLLGAHP